MIPLWAGFLLSHLVFSLAMGALAMCKFPRSVWRQAEEDKHGRL